MINVFISGPMTNVGGNFNFPLFNHVANRLRSTGKCVVFNPAELAVQVLGPLEVIQRMSKQQLDRARRELIKHSLVWICEKADVVLQLPGWRSSDGAKSEYAAAVACDTKERPVAVRECPNIIIYDSPIDESTLAGLLLAKQEIEERR